MRNMENSELQKSTKWGAFQHGGKKKKKTREGDLSLSEVCMPLIITAKRLTRVEKDAEPEWDQRLKAVLAAPTTPAL